MSTNTAWERMEGLQDLSPEDFPPLPHKQLTKALELKRLQINSPYFPKLHYYSCTSCLINYAYPMCSVILSINL